MGINFNEQKQGQGINSPIHGALSILHAGHRINNVYGAFAKCQVLFETPAVDL